MRTERKPLTTLILFWFIFIWSDFLFIGSWHREAFRASLSLWSQILIFWWEHWRSIAIKSNVRLLVTSQQWTCVKDELIIYLIDWSNKAGKHWWPIKSWPETDASNELMRLKTNKWRGPLMRDWTGTTKHSSSSCSDSEPVESTPDTMGPEQLSSCPYSGGFWAYLV